MAERTRSKRRRVFKRVCVVAVVLSLAAVMGFILLLVSTPDWYEPATVPEQDRQALLRRLVQAEQSFTEALRADAPFQYHLFDDLINRWIAMQHDVLPVVDDLIPEFVNDLHVRFAEGGVCIGGRQSILGVDVVVSVRLRAWFEEEGIVLRVESARCGSLPLPLNWEALQLGRRIECKAERLWPGSPGVAGDLLTGLRIGREAWWKNGGIRYRVENVEVAPGKLSLSIQPLGMRETKRSSQD